MQYRYTLTQRHHKLAGLVRGFYQGDNQKPNLRLNLWYSSDLQLDSEMASEKVLNLAPDLTRTAPRSSRAYLGAYGAIAARALDKCRAEIAGRAGPYHYNCPLDRVFFNFTGIDAGEFKRFVETGAGDREVADWIANKSRVRDPRLVSRWNLWLRLSPMNWILQFDDWLHIRRHAKPASSNQ